MEVLFVSAGVGLGGGIVRGGQLVRGATGFAGEFGHMTLDRDGVLCKCGNRGCWETFVSKAALFQYIQEYASRDMPLSLVEERARNSHVLTLPLIAEAARAGDRAVLQALQRLGGDFGIGIASLVNALNPQLVVIGGMLTVVGEFLLPAVQAEVRRRALCWNAGTTEVVLARHGSDACVMGGVATVLQSVLAPPGTGPLLRDALFPTLMPVRLAGQHAGARRAGSQSTFAMAPASPGA
jgi:predicted NBD/HSP70 family sugar kinase